MFIGKRGVILIICLSVFVYYKKCCKIIKVRGGIGNQMFQYAYGYALRKKNKINVIYDTSRFKDKNYIGHGGMLLNVFNTDTSAFSSKSILDYLMTGSWYYFSYCQSSTFFDEFRDDILKIFTLKKSLDNNNQNMLNDIISHKNSVSIHVRRGDYVGNERIRETIGVISMEYYQKAIKLFNELGYEDIHYYVFSDDIEWCKENMTFVKPVTFVHINDEYHGYLDMWLMKHCRHNIITNSTLSWWGAY